MQVRILSRHKDLAAGSMVERPIANREVMGSNPMQCLISKMYYI